MATTATLGSRTAERLGDACGCERRDARGRERRARLDDTVAGPDVAAEGSHVRARLGRGRHLHGAVAFGDELDRHHGVRSLGDDTAGRDPHRLTGAERPRGRLARGDVRDDRGAFPGVSAARRANPSIAELGKRGRSTTARASSASTRHAASSIGTGSPGSGCARARTCARASSTETGSATALTVHTGYARARDLCRRPRP